MLCEGWKRLRRICPAFSRVLPAGERLVAGQSAAGDKKGAEFTKGSEAGEVTPVLACDRERVRPQSAVSKTSKGKGNDMTADKLVHDLKAISRDAEDMLQATAGELGEKARDARARLTSALESAKATCGRLQDQAVAGARATDKAIREHPYQTVGVAFGVGLLVGVLALRRGRE